MGVDTCVPHRFQVLNAGRGGVPASPRTRRRRAGVGTGDDAPRQPSARKASPRPARLEPSCPTPRRSSPAPPARRVGESATDPPEQNGASQDITGSRVPVRMVRLDLHAHLLTERVVARRTRARLDTEASAVQIELRGRPPRWAGRCRPPSRRAPKRRTPAPPGNAGNSSTSGAGKSPSNRASGRSLDVGGTCGTAAMRRRRDSPAIEASPPWVAIRPTHPSRARPI